MDLTIGDEREINLFVINTILLWKMLLEHCKFVCWQIASLELLT